MSSYKHCITESAADRQRQFEAALLELMEHKNYSQISVQEICDRVGLSRKSFYRYFSGKESCLEALVDHTFLAFTEIDCRDGDVTRLLEPFFAYWQQHRTLLDVLSRNGMIALLYERAAHCAAQEYHLRECLLQPEGSNARTVFFISGLIGVLIFWHQEGCQKSPAQLAASVGQMLSNHSRSIF